MEFYLSPAVQQRSLEINLQGFQNDPLFSSNGEFVRMIQERVRPFHFQIAPSADGVQVNGDDAAVLLVSRIVAKALEAKSEHVEIDPPWLENTILAVAALALRGDFLFRLQGLRYPLVPKTFGQVAYMRTLLSASDQFVIGLGSTGTGKTHLAISAALNQLAEGHVKRIVITRPHVVMEGEVVTASTRQELEADTQLEFFEDILCDLIGFSSYKKLIEERKLAILPLGHMRGRTFNNAFIIIDEAQNMSIRKMRMALTRMGRSSRMVVTGDPVHVDLIDHEPSGLQHLLDLLEGTQIAKVHHFERSQVIRDPLVAKLENLYARDTAERQDFAA